MARLKLTTKDIEESEADREVIDFDQVSKGEDLSQGDADPSELMGQEKPEATLRFGSSLVPQNLIDFYVEKGYFKSGVCCPPGREDTPEPRADETVVFHNFFTAGLHFALDPNVMDIVSRYNAKLHHLTPNCIIQFSKFFWAVKSFNAPVSADTSCRFYELHPQSRKISFEGEDEVFNAQSGCCTFIPRRGNKALKLDRVELSYCQKNKWEDDWGQYWFYAKLAFSGSECRGIPFHSWRRLSHFNI